MKVLRIGFNFLSHLERQDQVVEIVTLKLIAHVIIFRHLDRRSNTLILHAGDPSSNPGESFPLRTLGASVFTQPHEDK